MSGKQDGEIYEHKCDVIKDGSCSNVFVSKTTLESKKKTEQEDKMNVMHPSKTRYIKTRRRKNKAGQSDVK